MPTPAKGESRDSFLARCIPYVYEEGDIKSAGHAAAKCHGIYDQHKKKEKEAE